MENLDKNMILEKITNEINRFMTKTRGKTRKVAEICAKHPEIFLEIQKPDTVLKYYLDRENNISAITMSLSEYKEKDFPLSTIRNTRRDIELFLAKKGINLEIGSLLQKKGLFMKIERAKGNKNF